jgi:predicted RNase H-like HicB family nuclease
MTKQYAVIFEPGPKNWSAYAPDLPGCVATGATREEIEQMIQEAIQFYIEGLQLHGEQVPEPTSEAGTVSVSV